MRDGEPNVYVALVALRTTYMQQQWNRVQMFLAFNIIGVPLVLGTGQPEVVKFFVSLIGFLMHLTILVATVRADGWMTYFDQKLAGLEEADRGSADDMRTMIFSDPVFTEGRASLLASRRLFGVAGVGIAIFWLVQSVNHGFRYLFL